MRHSQNLSPTINHSSTGLLLGCRLLGHSLWGAPNARDAESPVLENFPPCEPQHDISSRLQCLSHTVVYFPSAQLAVVAAIAEDDEPPVPVGEVRSGGAANDAVRRTNSTGMGC